MTQQNLETVVKPLAEGYPLFEPETILTSAELTTERRTNKELITRWFYTANVPFYAVEDNEAILYFGERKAFNAILGANIEEACRQLTNTGNYRPGSESTKAVIEGKEVSRFSLSGLTLERLTDEFGYFTVDTKGYKEQLNVTQRKFTELVYGKEDFEENMKLLAYIGIETTRIYVLNPTYVLKNARDGPIVRACWLGYLSSFSAYARIVGFSSGLRGVRKSAECGKPKK